MPTSAPAPEPIPFLDVRAAYLELRGELDDAAARVLSSGRYVLGEEVEAFEAEFAAYCGARACVATGNGLDALRLTIEALGVRPGDEVIVPAHTFIATWLGVHHAGARPVPVEPDARTYLLDPERVAALVGARTRGIVAVHLYGRPADMAALNEIAARHGLWLIEDAAQAHGARAAGRACGSLGRAAAFSFYPAKNLGAFGDGGAVVTDDARLAERVRLLGNYGAASKYEHVVKGHNSRLDPLQAAFLRVRLRRLDAWNERRRALAAAYDAGLAGLSGLSRPPADDEARSAWHLYVVAHAHRDALRRRLAERGIETGVHYPVPPHRSPAFTGSHDGAGLPITERLAQTVVSLPIGPHLLPAQVERVVAAVRAFAAEPR